MTQRGAPRRALWAAQAMILAVALWARLSRVGEVFVGNETIPVEQDCYYHLRRILMTAGDFPHAPIRDPLINWPHGADCGWAPGFDQLGALAVLASGASSSAAGARVAALLPVALGAGCVLATMWLVRTVLERHPRRDWIALGAGWLLSILPQAVATSRVGRIDHHVAEALLVALLCGWAARRGAAVGAPREGAAGRGDVGFEVAGAGLLIAAVHVFAGSVLYAAVAAIVLIGAAIAEPRPAALRRALVGSGAPAFAGAAAALALLARPQVAAHGRAFSHRSPSFMQPALIALAAAAIALATATPLLVRAAPGADRVSPGEALRRIGAFAAGAIALVAITAILLPRARGEVFSGLSGWRAKEDPYMASIDETRPMLLGMSPLDPAAWGRVYSYFGVVGLLAPVTLPVAIVAAVRRDRGPGASFAAFTLAIAGLTLAQSRFGRELVV
ncbi:MAG: hypothetical protein IT372_25600, partial [Polyangiaceae bacterium]|nr:hypothetical protein [Polyangiaceae bacterium]